MRLFVAVYPSAEAVAHLRAAVAALPPATLPAWRFTPPEQWHLTLRFLGEVPDDRVAALQRRLQRVSHADPFTVWFAGAGTFGGRARARVLWAGVGGDSAAFRRLALDCGAEDPRAHLTLARARGRDGAAAGELMAALGDYRGPSWTADTIALVHSRLGPHVTHTLVAAYPLHGRHPAAGGDGAAGAPVPAAGRAAHPAAGAREP